MKRFIFIILFLLPFLNVNAQTFGSWPLDVNGTFSNTQPVYQTWLRMGNTQNAIIKFRLTPEGLNEAMQLAQQMLFKNRLEMDKPYFYHSVESPDIKDDDPTALHKSIQAGESKINLSWYASDGAMLHLFLGRYSYEITVYNAYKIR